MKIKIGDLVRFVDEAIEGHVTSFQSGDMIGVTDESGFEIPVPMSKVTLIHGRIDEEEYDGGVDREIAQGPFVAEGIYVSVTGDQKLGLATFHLVNETSYDLLYGISEVLSQEKVKGIQRGALAARSSSIFYTANFNTVGKWPTFLCQVLRFSSDSRIAVRPIDVRVRFKGQDLSVAKKRLSVFEEKAWLQQLDPEEEVLNLDRLSHFGRVVKP